MAARRQTQVIAEMDALAGRAVGRMAKDYQESLAGPMVAAIKRAKSPEGLLAQLGPGTVRKMNTKALVEALVNTDVQAGGIGYVSAMPGKTSKSRKVKTSKQEADG